MEPIQYQTLFGESIFIGGASCVVDAVNNENIDIILDLRAETIASEWKENNNVKWVHIPLVGNKDGQEALLKQAINTALNAFNENQKVLIH